MLIEANIQGRIQIKINPDLVSLLLGKWKGK